MLENNKPILFERQKEPINYSDLQDFREEIFLHLDKNSEEIKTLIKSGFPEGDLPKHREVHEKFIANAQDRQDMWKSLRDHIIKGFAWSGIGILCLAVWEFLKAELRK